MSGSNDRLGVGVSSHRVPAAGPVGVSDQPCRQGVAGRGDAEQVADLPLEAAGAVVERGQAGDRGLLLPGAEHQLAPGVVAGSDEHVDHPEAVVVLVSGEQGDAVAVARAGSRPPRPAWPR